MAALSSSQIRAYADAAGFKGTVLDDMVGIAYAESGGDPRSHNSKPPDDSYGLWQINMLGSMGPSRRKQFGISSNEQLFDPGINAHAAYVIYKAQGLDAWTTYKSGAYLKHMDGKGGAGTNADAASPVDSTATGFSGITAALNAVGSNIFKALANSVGIGVALVLLLAGVAILVVSSKQGKAALTGATKAVVK